METGTASGWTIVEKTSEIGHNMEEGGYDCVGWKVMPWEQPNMSHNSGTLHVNDMDTYNNSFAT